MTPLRYTKFGFVAVLRLSAGSPLVVFADDIVLAGVRACVKGAIDCCYHCRERLQTP